LSFAAVSAAAACLIGEVCLRLMLLSMSVGTLASRRTRERSAFATPSAQTPVVPLRSGEKAPGERLAVLSMPRAR